MQKKDLAQEAPRSAFERVGGFVILGRTIDKCRANISGTPGEYHFNCPLDKYLFSFKDIDAEQFKAFVAEGHTDEEIGEWVGSHGLQKTDEEIAQWNTEKEHDMYYEKEDKRDWFAGECAHLGLDPKTTSLFQYLDVDDKVSFGGPAVCPIE